MASNLKKIAKVFIDSSVLIAAAISTKGTARDLIMKSFRGELKMIVSDLVIEETQRNLEDKAPEADYLVSFDRKHLLQQKQEIKANFKIKVVTPDELTK